MKTLIASVVAASGLLAGCVAVPVAEPGVHISATVRGHHHHGYGSARPAPPPRYRRDRDGDGVPNRYDRRPHNPYRY